MHAPHPEETPIDTPPLVSVVIPAHDVAPWIDELLESVLAAGVDDLEVIVVDDHSTDDTGERIARFASRDDRILHHLTDTYGAAAARNEGVRLARGEYLVFADADDLVPRGAYAALVESLQESGSDFAIGDHLKFSPVATWSPTARWFAFDELLRGVAPAAVPSLVSGRAAWNRMFRRTFWDEHALAFPEVVRNDDIVPMTRAFTLVTAIDVVPSCVYLYRDRPGGTSMTAGTPPEVAARLYFEQELICAERVADFGDPGVTEQYSRLVLDADGWVHLSGYLEQLPAGEVADPAVVAAFAALMRVVPRSGFSSAAADRRALMALAEAGRIEDARVLAVAAARARASRQYDADGLAGWAAALGALESVRVDAGWPASRASGVAGAGPSTAAGAGLDLGALLVEGPLTALANDAALADVEALRPTVRALAATDSVRVADAAAVESVILRWMLLAVRSGDAEAVARVSLVRRAVPLVVDTVDAGPQSLDLGGPLPWPDALDGARLVLRAEGRDDVVQDRAVRLPGSTPDASARWSATVSSADLAGSGRYAVLVRFSAGDAVEPQEHAVVTARMPLPPLPADHELQPLSDRARGWVFLVDRRAPAARGLLGKVASRLRRG